MSEIPPDIEFEVIPIDQLKFDPVNANQGTQRGMSALEASLEHDGVGRSVLIDKDGYLVAGNKTAEIASQMGIEEVVVIKSNGKRLIAHQREDFDLLHDPKTRQHAVRDNLVGQQNLDWDAVALQQLMSEGVELTGDGLWYAEELDELLKKLAEEEPLDAELQEKIDKYKTKGDLKQRFIIPPFSIWDSRQGYWLDRERTWLNIGIESEKGREDELVFSKSAIPSRMQDLRNDLRTSLRREPTIDEVWAEAERLGIKTPTQTSVFSPVVCELVYRWFNVEGGKILDPFAGGSVRGIVAGWLGFPYTGIDLRSEQVDANYANWQTISDDKPSDVYQVKVSAAMARLPFNGCDPDYIRTTCHASCCQSSTSPTGTLITIHPSEIGVMEQRGAVVLDGLLQPRPGEKRCPFKTDDHLCGLHFTPDKPFGCIASPFTLNDNDTLIVRNRYKTLRCYNDGAKIPAYRAFSTSLKLIFGDEAAQQLIEHFDNGGDDIMLPVSADIYHKLHDNDAIKKGAVIAEKASPRWLCGDSRQLDSLIDDGQMYDLVFSCPPYMDLETYSDNPSDLSNLNVSDFERDYFAIIAAACNKLNDNRFAVFVVGEVRDKKSTFYRNFVGMTIRAFESAGLHFYNEIILIDNYNSLPLRVAGYFRTRKMGKTHQNVLVFYKGDNYRDIPHEFAMPSEDEWALIENATRDQVSEAHE